MTFEKEKSVFKKNTLFYGDNLEIMRKFPDECVDLIYLDPPFNSKANYNVLFQEASGEKSTAQIQAFSDFWTWDQKAMEAYNELMKNKNKKICDLFEGLFKFLGKSDMMAYLVMMGIRLIEMHRILKKTGSIYLHCDQSANSYLRLVMDAIFGFDKFQNEIIWHYHTGGISKKSFGRKHDNIFRYTKSNEWLFNVIKERRYYEKPFFGATEDYQKDEQGRLYVMAYQDDVWDIPAVINVSKERLGYPTQKPEALLERIIKASSNDGDVVLDPFCGCGTTVAVAERLGRKWIGIDITYLAIHIIKDRLDKSKADYEIDGIPKDIAGAEALASKDKYQFQQWAVLQIGAIPLEKKGADEGKDGWIKFPTDKENYGDILVQVKSGHVGVKDIREFDSVLNKHNAKMGVFITLEEPTSPMYEWTRQLESFKIKSYLTEFPKIQIQTISELLKRDGKRPMLPPLVGGLKDSEAIKKESKKSQKKLEECSADKADPSSAS